MKKSPNSSLQVKISDIAVKATERTAADTSKSSPFNWGQGYNRKINLTFRKYRNHGNYYFLLNTFDLSIKLLRYL